MQYIFIIMAKILFLFVLLSVFVLIETNIHIFVYDGDMDFCKHGDDKIWILYIHRTGTWGAFYKHELNLIPAWIVVLPIDIENPYRLSNCLYR